MKSIDLGQYKSMSGKVGTEFKVEPITLPSDAKNSVLNLVIDDTEIATSNTVDNSANGAFFITLNAPGTTTAHFTATDGGGAKIDATITSTEA